MLVADSGLALRCGGVVLLCILVWAWVCSASFVLSEWICATSWGRGVAFLVEIELGCGLSA